ncbi:GNAT family N-acetyltransferase [Catenulispora rubra]|uniref:GNAT family N-acetyltransferase n=1 Tax=Catenulispora rubra TaxID=280293 RepID=UPI00189241B3|nr:GNAT family N-acetyltransferase [Catenulispora rubra]
MATESSNSTLTWRPVAPGDAAACAVLLNAIEDVDHFGEFFGEDDVAELIGDPVLDLARGSLGVFDGEAMVGYFLAKHKPLAVGQHRVMLEGGVHPVYRRRGIGARLLSEGIASARELHAIHHPELALAVDAQNNERNAGALAAYAAAGMASIRWYSQMAHDLREVGVGVGSGVEVEGGGEADGGVVVRVPVPAGFVVEKHSADNSEEFLAVRNEAFLDHWGAVSMPAEQWHSTMVGWQSFRPDLSFLIRDGATSAAAGMLLTHSWDSDTEATGIRDAHFMLIGTRSAYRKRGVASALIALAEQAAKAGGYDQASLTVDSASPTGAIGLYERAGFAVTGTHVRYAVEF